MYIRRYHGQGNRTTILYFKLVLAITRTFSYQSECTVLVTYYNVAVTQAVIANPFYE